ncbi:hypothetical protein Lser_V15G39986 [Lactuca serriola]
MDCRFLVVVMAGVLAKEPRSKHLWLQTSCSVRSRGLLWLWMAEGFLQEDGSRSLEETAKGYLMDLVERNLVIAERRYITGDVSSCKVHDLVRQLCMEKGKEERFLLRIDSPPTSNHLCEVVTTHKQRRVVINQESDVMSLSHPTTQVFDRICALIGKQRLPTISQCFTTPLHLEGCYI